MRERRGMTGDRHSNGRRRGRLCEREREERNDWGTGIAMRGGEKHCIDCALSITADCLSHLNL